MLEYLYFCRDQDSFYKQKFKIKNFLFYENCPLTRISILGRYVTYIYLIYKIKIVSCTLQICGFSLGLDRNITCSFSCVKIHGPPIRNSTVIVKII